MNMESWWAVVADGTTEHHFIVQAEDRADAFYKALNNYLYISRGGKTINAYNVKKLRIEITPG